MAKRYPSRGNKRNNMVQQPYTALEDSGGGMSAVYVQPVGGGHDALFVPPGSDPSDPPTPPEPTLGTEPVNIPTLVTDVPVGPGPVYSPPNTGGDTGQGYPAPTFPQDDVQPIDPIVSEVTVTRDGGTITPSPGGGTVTSPPAGGPTVAPDVQPAATALKTSFAWYWWVLIIVVAIATIIYIAKYAKKS